MITLRCTRKLLRRLGEAPEPDEREPTSSIGDWYANLIETVAGEQLIFVNEASRLSVALPASTPPGALAGRFRMRVIALFRHLDLPAEAVQREAFHLGDVKFGRTRSRTILGAMNEVARVYQLAAERGEPTGATEQSLAKFIHLPLKGRYPREVARDLLGGVVLEGDGDDGGPMPRRQGSAGERSPSDNQGVRFVLPAADAGEPWQDR